MVAKEKTENKQKGSVPNLHPLLGAKSSRGAPEGPLPNSREQNQPLH